MVARCRVTCIFGFQPVSFLSSVHYSYIVPATQRQLHSWACSHLWPITCFQSVQKAGNRDNCARRLGLWSPGAPAAWSQTGKWSLMLNEESMWYVKRKKRKKKTAQPSSGEFDRILKMHSQQNRWSKPPSPDGLAQLTDQGRNHQKHRMPILKLIW